MYGFAGKLPHFLRGLLPIATRKLVEVFAIRHREVLQVMLDISKISDESYPLATLGLQQGGTGLCRFLDIVNPAFEAFIISSVIELQIEYPDIKNILANGQCLLPTVQALHTVVQQLS